jgi:hypothetical protein
MAWPKPTPAAAANRAGVVALTPKRALRGTGSEAETQVFDVRDGLGEQDSDMIVVQGIDDAASHVVTVTDKLSKKQKGKK